MMDLNYEVEIPDGVLLLVTFCLTLVLTKLSFLYSVNTTLATFFHSIYSGRNISEVLIFFFKKRRPTLRTLRVNTKKINTVRSKVII